MVCANCRTTNLSDYKFCRECGTRLDTGAGAAPDPASTETRVEQLLREAFEAMDRGDLDQAAGTVLAAMALSPDSASAHSVLGIIYERQGRIPEAVAQFERVLEINPESTADREKLNELLGRSGGASTSRLRRMPLAIGAAVVAAAAVFGLGFALLSQGGATRAAQPERAPDRILASSLAPRTLPPPPTTATGSLQPAAGSPGGPAPLNAPSAGAKPAGAPRPAPLRPVFPAPRATPQEPVLRIGLPPMRNNPAPPSTGLQPARIGEIVPFQPPPAGSLPGASGAPPAGAAPAGPAAPAATAEQTARRDPPREPFESDTGFIRIAPRGPQPQAAGSPSGGAATGAGNAATGGPAAAALPGAPAGAGSRPRISVQINSTSRDTQIDEAYRMHRLGSEAARRRSPQEASRYYAEAARLYEAVAARGGGEAASAREGLEVCRRALAALAERR
jgi:hypothetical protein